MGNVIGILNVSFCFVSLWVLYLNDFADEVDDDNYEPPTKRTFRKRGRPRKSGNPCKGHVNVVIVA